MTLYDEISKMKTILRKGWQMWNVGEKCGGRIESDAEHTFSMLLLALEIMSKKDLNLNQEKVMKMIAYHELCEIDYGDHTPFDKISYNEIFENESKCVKRLAEQYDMPEIFDLWKEYEENQSPEARFVKKLDKLDAILQSKVYAEMGNMPEMFEEFKNRKIEIFNEFNQGQF